ncbi:hypothetical protein GCM10009712_07180 [Pseudarthrobacter sulfonivorans]
MDRLAGEELEVPAARAECHYLKKVRGAVDDVNRLGADGTGGSEEDDSARLHGLSIPHAGSDQCLEVKGDGLSAAGVAPCAEAGN